LGRWGIDVVDVGVISAAPPLTFWLPNLLNRRTGLGSTTYTAGTESSRTSGARLRVPGHSPWN